MSLFMVGTIELGLSEARFWALTAREFRALVDKQREVRERAEEAANLRAGIIAAAVSNIFGGKKNGGHFAAKDFFNFSQQAQSRRRPSTEPLPDAEQAMTEQLWLNWAEAARAAANARGMAVA